VFGYWYVVVVVEDFELCVGDLVCVVDCVGWWDDVVLFFLDD